MLGWDFLLSYCGTFAVTISAPLLLAAGSWQLHLTRRQSGEEKTRTARLARNCLVGGLGCAVMAGCFILGFRANATGDPYYVETGRQIISESDHRFTVDEVTYEAVHPENLRALEPVPYWQGEPVFDYDDSPHGLVGAWNELLGLNGSRRGNYYTVSNDAGVDLVWANRRYRDLFCPASQHAQAEAWYGEESHYQWVYADEAVLPVGTELERLIALLQQAREEQAALNSMEDEERPGPGEVPGSALHTRLETFSQWPDIHEESLVLQSSDGLFYWPDRQFYIAWYEGRPYAADTIGPVLAGKETTWAFTPIPDELAALLPSTDRPICE